MVSNVNSDDGTYMPVSSAASKFFCQSASVYGYVLPSCDGVALVRSRISIDSGSAYHEMRRDQLVSSRLRPSDPLESHRCRLLRRRLPKHIKKGCDDEESQEQEQCAGERPVDELLRKSLHRL